MSASMEDDKEEARLLSAINKAKSGSLGRSVKAAPKNRPSPVIQPAPTTSPARQSIPAPAPSAFVRSPSQNFGNPNPKPLSQSSLKSPTATSTPDFSSPSSSPFSSSSSFTASPRDPAQSPRTPSARSTPNHSFMLSPRNFNSPQAVASPPVRSTSSSSVPSTQSPSTQPVRSTSHTYVPNTYQSPSQILSRTPSQTSLNLSSSSGVQSPVRTPSQNGFANGTHSPAHASQSSAPVPQVQRSSSEIALSLPPSRSSSSTNVKAHVQAPASPAQSHANTSAQSSEPAPVQSQASLQRVSSTSSTSSTTDQSIPQHLTQSFRELDALLEDNKKNYPSNAKIVPRTHSYLETEENPVQELDNLISDLRAAAAPPPHLVAGENQAPEPTPAPAVSASVSSSSSSSKSSTSSSAAASEKEPLPRGYGATFTSLMEFVEQSDSTSKQPPAEYPTPVPSSRLNNSRKFSIPPRPAHEDSSESLLERKLIGEASPTPKPRTEYAASGLAVSSTTQSETTNEASAEVHPAFQSTYDSINDMLADPLSPAKPIRITSSSSITAAAEPTPVVAPAPVPVAAPIARQPPAPIITKTHSYTSNSTVSPATPSTLPNTPSTVASSAPATPTTAASSAPSTPSYDSASAPNTPSTAASSAYSSLLNTPMSTPKPNTAPKEPSFSTPTKSNPLDSVETMLASLEERTREDVPRTPTTVQSHAQPVGNQPVLAPVANSSREIRTALEVYQPETVCEGCGQGIHGRHLLALGKHWHDEHFQCVLCYKPILQYAEYNEKPYCGPCYTRNFLAPRCVACGDNIMKEMVEALGGQYHVDCFKCANCHNVFPDGIFVESKISSKVYCEKCYYKVEGKQCAKCNEPITDAAFTEIMGKSLHKNCFKCFGCDKPFTSMECYPVDNNPYCYDCASERA